jgi:hypothetical protein
MGRWAHVVLVRVGYHQTCGTSVSSLTKDETNPVIPTEDALVGENSGRRYLKTRIPRLGRGAKTDTSRGFLEYVQISRA